MSLCQDGVIKWNFNVVPRTTLKDQHGWILLEVETRRQLKSPSHSLVEMFTRLLSFAAGLAAISAATVKDCGAGTSAFKIQALGLTPTAPSPGQDVTLHLEYDVPAGTTVTGGTTTYAVTLNFIPFQPSTEPLCQDIPCPLGPGSYKNDTTSSWPSGISGSFTSKMTWADEVGTQLLCVQISGTAVDTISNVTNMTVWQPPIVPPTNIHPTKRGNLRK
jgi:hypothetical protein